MTRTLAIVAASASLGLGACASVPKYVAPTTGDTAKVRFVTGKVTDGSAGLWGTASMDVYTVADKDCAMPQKVGRVSTAPLNFGGSRSLDMPLADGPAGARMEVLLPAGEEIFTVLVSEASSPGVYGSTVQFIGYIFSGTLEPGGLYERSMERPSTNFSLPVAYEIVPTDDGYAREQSETLTSLTFPESCRDLL